MPYPSYAQPYSPWLEDTWSALYHGMTPKTGGQGFVNYWKGGESSVYNQYLGKLGSMALSGQEPNLSAYDFLNQFPWQSQYMNQTPSRRGVNYADIRPRTIWDVWDLSRRRSY